MRAARLFPAPVLAGLLLAVARRAPGLPRRPHDRVVGLHVDGEQLGGEQGRSGAEHLLRLDRQRLGGADLPPAGGEHPRMNLWLFRGKAPKNAKTIEVVVQSFAFTAG